MVRKLIYQLTLIVINIHQIICVHMRRPIYNIGHMVNTIDQVDSYIEKGANAIEVDVQFVADGTPVHMFHGIPCDCLRDCSKWSPFEQYIQHIRDISTPDHIKYKERFVLLILDLKTENMPPIIKSMAGEKLFNSLLEHLFNHGYVLTRVNILLTIQRVTDEPLMDGFIHAMDSLGLSHLNKHIGWDVSANEALDVISTMYHRRLPRTANVWQSDGITNCVSFIYPTDRLRAAIQLRDQFRRPYMTKVYRWTIDMPFVARDTFRLGVDGILTNYPDRIATILNEDEFYNDLRLANHTDDPWARYDGPHRLSPPTNHLQRLHNLYSIIISLGRN
ncbi:unnamed protein product [Medioppia subpectinata]|uniref:Uncharacterized protein n=1 Tax=Medioppia subpectinata TaxID=1979941 RepID=A0A7R9L5I0_9ACAR|nr:unnamed protein product [Medioppia subpectinata]CAG2114685.1 unnamed protein product [Medioppia subpectinata]